MISNVGASVPTCPLHLQRARMRKLAIPQECIDRGSRIRTPIRRHPWPFPQCGDISRPTYIRILCVCACAHACALAWSVGSCVRAPCMRACVHACIRACVHACMCARVHAHQGTEGRWKLREGPVCVLIIIRSPVYGRYAQCSNPCGK